jgi:hypothetical protein
MGPIRRCLVVIAAISVIAVVIFVGTDISLGENSRLTETVSPDKTVLLLKEQKPEGGVRIFFVDAVTNEKLGAVLSLLNEGDLANVSVVSSWNSSSSHVALLIYYGVRSSKIKLFKKDDHGRFAPIDLSLPDPLSIYGKAELRKLSEEHVGASENSLGPWTTDNSVRLVSGIMVDRGNNEFVHLFATFTAVINAKTDIKDLKLFGPYSDHEADAFLEKWGAKYWEEPDRTGR